MQGCKKKGLEDATFVEQQPDQLSDRLHVSVLLLRYTARVQAAKQQFWLLCSVQLTETTLWRALAAASSSVVSTILSSWWSAPASQEASTLCPLAVTCTCADAAAAAEALGAGLSNMAANSSPGGCLRVRSMKHSALARVTAYGGQDISNERLILLTDQAADANAMLGTCLQERARKTAPPPPTRTQTSTLHTCAAEWGGRMCC